MNPSKPIVDQPAWDLSREYASFDDPAFHADLAEINRLLGILEGGAPRIKEGLDRAETLDPGRDRDLLGLLQDLLAGMDSLVVLVDNLSAYAACMASVDGKDPVAKEYRGSLSELGARVDAALAPMDQVLARCPEAFLQPLLDSPQGGGHRFRIGQMRKYRQRLLGVELEEAILRLGVNGPEAWNRLYQGIVGTASCELQDASGTKRLGLAQATALLKQGNREVRKAAFEALADAYSVHEESLAAILNALAGWRLTEYDMRSKLEPYHFLDAALAQNRLSRKSLDALFAAVDGARDLGRRALGLQARLLGTSLAPWDLLAPCPETSGEAKAYTFAEGLELVRASYARIHPSMGDFVLAMAREGNIEARVLPNKRPGAYCTGFAKSKDAKVFQTYTGSLGDVSTLAHELGHAWHSHLMKDLHREETHYPMNLAETASTFGETALADYLADSPGASRARLLEVGWSDAQDAATFLLNIPARFVFEKAFYEARAEKPLGPAALSDLMGQAWDHYYGPSLSGRDPGFWKGKLHFYMSGRTFYNFPYTFGYLFSLGVYAKRAELGEGFHGAYTALLRDTGRMESEELAQRHLGVDLGDPDFWRSSIRIVEAKLDRFEALL